MKKGKERKTNKKKITKALGMRGNDIVEKECQWEEWKKEKRKGNER